MATLSFSDLKETALPTLWDAAELKKIALASGETLEGIAAEVQRGLQILNGTLLTLPHYGDLIAVQDTPEVEYPIGVSNGFEEATEYGIPTPKRGDTSGHMIPLRKYDRSVGWTFMYLREARRSKLDADIRSVVTDAKSIWQKKILERFFKVEGETVGSTSNASVPFVDAAATDTKYVPPESMEGKTFASSHTHFARVSALSQANVETHVAHLQEHGHQAPYDAIISDTDKASWAALSGFKKPEWGGIVYHASATERAAISEITNYIGYLETPSGIIRLWATPRLPTNYYGIFKTYGPGDSRNPLRIRLSRTVGFGFNLVPGMYVNSPTTLLLPYAEFGVGVGEDRTNGVCVYIAGSGSYVTPTIS